MISRSSPALAFILSQTPAGRPFLRDDAGQSSHLIAVEIMDYQKQTHQKRVNQKQTHQKHVQGKWPPLACPAVPSKFQLGVQPYCCSRPNRTNIALLLFLATSILFTSTAIGEELSSADRVSLAEQIPAAAKRDVDFVADVQPILREHCFECHAGEVEEGELNLAVKAKAMAGGESGAVISTGDSLASLLVHLVSGVDSERVMPPDGNDRLSDVQIGILRAWIDQGASWPDGVDVADPRLERAASHWAFARLTETQPPPQREDDAWSQTEIDLFVAKQLHDKHIAPSPKASGRQLVRRLYFDLIGLPPTIEQTDAFLQTYQQDATKAIEDLADQLLASEQYGERWGRHWLDLARYADSDGQESDRDRPHAYHYRDFVIRAFNLDMPFNQFVRWQLAGDEYDSDNDDAVIATGFLTAGPSFKLKDTFLESERLFNRYNELDDVISTVGTGLLGITVGCARCHDHKYDAFSAREYYQLLSVFHSGDRTSSKLPSGKDGFFFQDFDEKIRTTWLFRRSDFYDREIEVSLGFPVILSDNVDALTYLERARDGVAEPSSTLQRRALADWITDVDHGGGALLARVFVNRVWQHHFGFGLVRTASDFGVRGDAPSHPGLLEYLANDFVANGWSVKHLHRKIVSSAVWQQGDGQRVDTDTVAGEDPAEIDPQNRLLWKMRPQRLQAEVLRDAMLAVSGTLNEQSYGPGFKPYIPPEANLARNIQGSKYPNDAKDDASTRRRSVYMFHKRLIPYPMFQAFDRPDLMHSCARRQNTTVAPQAMAILNDRFIRAVARDFADRLLRGVSDNGESDASLQQMIATSFQLSFARSPTDAESNSAAQFVRSQAATRQARNEEAPYREAIADYCHALFGLNEFINID